MTEQTCPTDHRHGETSTCYIEHSCRCASCRDARAEYGYWARHMRDAGRAEVFRYAVIDSTGTRRRIQALGALGWSQRAIARAAGTDQNRVHTALNSAVCARITAERIDDAFEALSFRLPPETTQAERTSAGMVRAHAHRLGWLPPLAWDDIDNDPDPSSVTADADLEDDEEETPAAEPDIDVVAVDLAITGRHVHLTPAERRVAVAALHAKYYSGPLIAQMLSCSVKTVERIRDELGLEPHHQNDVIDTRTAA